jgi:hypothetical protein
MGNVKVVMHRVAERPGPVDSAVTDAKGRYRLTYRAKSDDSAVYFATAMYAGLSYLTPFMRAGDTGEEQAISVYDTTSATVPITVRERHLVVTAVETDALRSVVEVVDLATDSPITRVPKGSGPDGATWSMAIPQRGTDYRVTAGTIPEEAVTFDAGRIRVFTPLSPLVRQLSFSYSFPGRETVLDLPIDGPVAAIEILLEDARATVSGASFRELESANIEGRRFRRFAAERVEGGAVVKISLPRPARELGGWFLALLIGTFGALMLLALARAYSRR